MIKIEDITEVCNKHQITVEMFYIMYLMFSKNKRALQDYSKIAKLYRERALSDKEIKALIDKQLIVKKPDGSIVPSTIFNELFITKYEGADKVWEAYPSYTDGSDGKRLPLKSMDIAVFREIYITVIGPLKEHSDELVLDIKFAITNKYSLPKISTFIQSRQWEELRKERNSGFNLDEHNDDDNDKDFG